MPAHCLRVPLSCKAVPCRTGKVKLPSGFELAYKIVRPMPMSSQRAAPLVVLHGGPGVPSDYLADLEKLHYRTVLFFDQLSCGLSDVAQPSDHSIVGAISDVRSVLTRIGIYRYHLYGQSWGGILASEFLRSRPADDDRTCLSCIISSSPTSVPKVEAEVGRLIDGISAEFPEASDEERSEIFRRRHHSDTPELTPNLRAAYEKAGTVWRGTSAIADWEVDTTLPPIRGPPCMVMRGENDFVTQELIEDWNEVFAKSESHIFPGCGHHVLNEKPGEYIEVLEKWLARWD